jgi:hypothetical protein
VRFPVSVETLIVDGLAAARLTRLVTTDRVTRRARDLFIEGAYESAGLAAATRPFIDSPGDWAEWAAEDRDVPPTAYLVTCDWCTGAWVAALLALGHVVAPKATRVVTRAAAVAWVAGLLARPPVS